VTDRSGKAEVDDPRRTSPAAARNVGPIIAVLEEWLPTSGLMLEVASGTGEHAIAFARRFPHLDWQPSDPAADARASIAAWRDAHGSANLRPPLAIDAAKRDWPLSEAGAVLAINMVHISPWAAAIGLVEGAARILGSGAPLVLYGPWLEDDVTTAPSNIDFDADLKRRDRAWGLRHLATFVQVAGDRGFAMAERRPMPANNLMLLFRRR